MEEQTRNWGKPFGVLSFVFGIVSLAVGTLAILPYIGLFYAVLALVAGANAVGFGIPGVIGSSDRTKSIIGICFGGTMFLWAIIRIYGISGFGLYV